MKFIFYTKRLNQTTPKITKYPCFVIVETSWDDFDYKTQFKLNFYPKVRSKREIGFVKILQSKKKVTHLPTKFFRLGPGFCSIGQSNDFYSALYRLLTRKEITAVLKSLNDCTQSKQIFKKFEHEPGMKKSLLRDSEAQKAFNEMPFIIAGNQARNSFKFEFVTEIPGFVIPHKAFFDFTKSSPLPKRIAAIIGKNGSGKTQYLARLASSLSGDPEGVFSNTTLPPFSRVIAVSYSLFDRFKTPSESRSFSYYFCGFRSEKDFASIYQLNRRVARALKQLKQRNQIPKLQRYLAELLDPESSDRFLEGLQNGNPFELDRDRYQEYSKFSSGQILIMVILTEILAYIREESIILFDEPETHLHPNAISNLVGIIYQILKDNDSFAVIATHSPQIIQEIPSSLIYYFDNDKENPPVSKLPIETFGENLTTLTEKIFHTLDIDENYKKVIRQLYKNRTKNELLKFFSKQQFPLSMNARIFIEYLKKK